LKTGRTDHLAPEPPEVFQGEEKTGLLLGSVLSPTETACKGLRGNQLRIAVVSEGLACQTADYQLKSYHRLKQKKRSNKSHPAIRIYILSLLVPIVCGLCIEPRSMGTKGGFCFVGES